MGLPNIGPLELIIILAIALLIVGPGRLPDMGSAIGRTIKEFRNASSDMTDATKVEPDQTAEPQPNTLSTEAAPNTTATPTPDASGLAADAPPVADAPPAAESVATEPDAPSEEEKSNAADQA